MSAQVQCRYSKNVAQKRSTVPTIVRVLNGSEIRRQPFTGLTLTGSPPVPSFDIVVVSSGGGLMRPTLFSFVSLLLS